MQKEARLRCDHLLESFVNRSKPADIGAGRKENEPENCQSKIYSSAASNEPREAAHEIHRQGDAVHCKHTHTHRAE